MSKILVVEDNSQLAIAVSEVLTENGYEVMVVDSADGAFDELHASRYDLVMLDIMLPGGMNGFDVLEEIRRRPNWKSIKVIMMTNLDSEEKTARSIGVEDYIVKSNMGLDQIVERVKKVLAS